MIKTILNLLNAALGCLRGQRQLALENSELRQQIIILHRSATKPKIRNSDHYYNVSHCICRLNKDRPEPRPVEPVNTGKIVEMPILNGLHRRYYRRAA